jgi:hypothetical protein
MTYALWRDRSVTLTLWMQFRVKLPLLRTPVGLYDAVPELHSGL